LFESRLPCGVSRGGQYLATRYDIGFDLPEGHVIRTHEDATRPLLPDEILQKLYRTNAEKILNSWGTRAHT
jgi:hypothetical protein